MNIDWHTEELICTERTLHLAGELVLVKNQALIIAATLL